MKNILVFLAQKIPLLIILQALRGANITTHSEISTHVLSGQTDQNVIECSDTISRKQSCTSNQSNDATIMQHAPLHDAEQHKPSFRAAVLDKENVATIKKEFAT